MVRRGMFFLLKTKRRPFFRFQVHNLPSFLSKILTSLPQFHTIRAYQEDEGRGKDYLMAGKIDPKETVSIEELLMSIVMEQEALVNLLQEKGIIKKAELLEGVKKLKPKYNM